MMPTPVDILTQEKRPALVLAPMATITRCTTHNGSYGTMHVSCGPVQI